MMFFCLISTANWFVFFFFFNDTATTEIYTLSLHDALPISDGAEHRARRAVVSTIHIKHLAAVVGREHLGDEFLAGVDRWRTGVTMFVTHYALDAAPRYRTEQGPVASVGAGICATTDELLDALVAFRRGEVRVERPPLLAINATAIDPTRAPAGKHTLKLVRFLPYDLRDRRPERWDSIKQGVSE